tara:strand:+ start:491 stop:715 length:225 start_codon:yes stop_codon:yes gene_type:complete
VERYMTGEEIRQLARKHHNPKDRINDTWHPVYIDECRIINREAIEQSLMNKYNVSGKINKKAKGSTLYPGMGKA